MKKAISAQNTKMYLEDPNAAPLATGIITNASKSSPCVAVFDSVSDFADGLPIRIIGSGWASLDNQAWVLQNLNRDTKTAELATSNTSLESASLSKQAAYILHAFIDVCAKSYQINQSAAAQIDTTTLCDDEKTYLIGFSDPGTLTFDFFIDPTDPDYQVLVDAQKAGDVREFEIVYRNKAVRTLPVIVQSINESGGVDAAISGSATLKVSGPAILTLPAALETPSYLLVPTIMPNGGTAPLPVTMTMNENGGSASSYKVNWGDGSVAEAVNTKSASHTYAIAGSFKPIVTPTVNGMPAAPVKAPTVVVEAAPYSLVASVAPVEGVAPLDVTLTLQETNGHADSYAVDWGDGTAVDTTDKLSAIHTYAAAGSFTPKATPTTGGTAGIQVSATALTVTDAGG